MEYDPVKDRLASLLLRFPGARSLLFFLSRQYFLRELEIRARLRKLKREGFRPRRILDAGAGFGQYTRYLHGLFPQALILAVDLKESDVEDLRDYCRRAGLLQVDCRPMDLLELEFEEEFDLILNVDVMEHILDDHRVFVNFRRALKPGGLLLLHTPAVDEHAPDPERGGAEATVGEHVREGYKHSMLRCRLREAGFPEALIRPTYGSIGGVAWRLGVRWPMAVLGRSMFSLPLVALWLLLVLLPVRLLNELDLRRRKIRGGCLLLETRVPG